MRRMRTRRKRGVTGASLAMLAVAALAAGCESNGNGGTDVDPTGTVAGEVTAANAGVAGASLRLERANATTRTTTTNASGDYSFGNVAVGTWSVTITPPNGFELAAGQNASRNVTVADGQTASADFALSAVTGGGTTVDISASGMSFSPSTVTIQRGTTVRWTNNGGGLHTVTPDGHTQWTAATLSATGNTFSHTFNTAGTFAYYCDPHRSAGMTGTITVQ